MASSLPTGRRRPRPSSSSEDAASVRTGLDSTTVPLPPSAAGPCPGATRRGRATTRRLRPLGAPLALLALALGTTAATAAMLPSPWQGRSALWIPSGRQQHQRPRAPLLPRWCGRVKGGGVGDGGGGAAAAAAAGEAEEREPPASAPSATAAADEEEEEEVFEDALSSLPPSEQQEPQQPPPPQDPPAFFTIAERFQALAAAASASASEEDDEEEEEGCVAAAAAATTTAAGGGNPLLRYGVVAIVGPQASGKSTLLNALFGTRFPVLDAAATGIQRTTRGVWVDLMASAPSTSSALPRSSSPPPLIVLDTEGLESAARGAGGGSGLFDRQVSALAAAAADVVLLNLWARDLRGGRVGGDGEGLHTALLRALVAADGGQEEEDSGKQQQKQRRRERSLVVVLRDSEHPEGDAAVARAAVRRGLEEAAAEAGYARGGRDARPPRKAKKGKASAAGDDEGEGEGGGVLVVAGVRVAVVALPSRAFQPGEFAAAVAALRVRLLPSPSEEEADASSSRVSSLVAASQGSQQPVPLPEFPAFAEELWEAVLAETGGLVGGEAGVLGAPASALPAPLAAGGSKEEAARVRAFIRRKVVESCVREAEPAVARLERKVEAAREMPILEFGRDAAAVLEGGRAAVRTRLSSSAASSDSSSSSSADCNGAGAEAEVVAALARRMEPAFRSHVEALADFYFGKFQDRFVGMVHPPRQLEKEAKALTADITGAFAKAAAAAVPTGMEGQWEWEGPQARLVDEMDVEVADRRMEVEVLFPTSGDEAAMGGGGLRARLLRPTWWKRVLLKAIVVYVNYLQTVQAAQSLARAARRRQERYPPVPLF